MCIQFMLTKLTVHVHFVVVTLWFYMTAQSQNIEDVDSFEEDIQYVCLHQNPKGLHYTDTANT